MKGGRREKCRDRVKGEREESEKRERQSEGRYRGRERRDGETVRLVDRGVGERRERQ